MTEGMVSSIARGVPRRDLPTHRVAVFRSRRPRRRFELVGRHTVRRAMGPAFVR